MTPLYDVVSAQPSVDAGQICRNAMKLAMAVGDNRHYVVDAVLPRHFIQTAARSGIGASMLRPLFADLEAQAPAAIEKVRQTLAQGFQEEIAATIIGGFESRLRMLAA